MNSNSWKHKLLFRELNITITENVRIYLKMNAARPQIIGVAESA
jgi:hypothetical protein